VSLWILFPGSDEGIDLQMAAISESYPIVEIQPEWVLEPEALGSKEKFWYRARHSQPEFSIFPTFIGATNQERCFPCFKTGCCGQDARTSAIIRSLWTCPIRLIRLKSYLLMEVIAPRTALKCFRRSNGMTAADFEPLTQ
jgi:hypothetical protein